MNLQVLRRAAEAIWWFIPHFETDDLDSEDLSALNLDPAWKWVGSFFVCGPVGFLIGVRAAPLRA